METLDSIKDLLSRKPTTEQFQKIVSALRGPDAFHLETGAYGETEKLIDEHLNEALKQLTTSRIRGIVAPGYFGDRRAESLNSDERKTRDLLLDLAPKHFSSHYTEACKAISEVYKYDLINEKDLTKKTLQQQLDSSKGISLAELMSVAIPSKTEKGLNVIP